MLFFFFNDTATTEIYTLSLHDALPISGGVPGAEFVTESGRLPELWQILSDAARRHGGGPMGYAALSATRLDRKSTRLNSSHSQISYAVFCLKKKQTNSMHSPSIKVHVV